MKKNNWFIFGLAFLGCSAFGLAAIEVKEVARNIAVGPITVSTTTVSTMSVSGFAPLSGRYRVRVENTDMTFRVAVGTSPTMTFAQGYVLDVATNSALAFIDLPLNAGTTLWAIGQNNSTQGTVNTRVIELK